MTSLNEPLDCIRNGMIHDGVGHRAVSFTVDESNGRVRLRTMISQKTTERIHGWNAGVQSVREGDFVAMSSWCKKHKKLQLFRVHANGKLIPSRKHGGSFNSPLLTRLPKCIIKFLEPCGGGPSYLPSGYWRSKYDMIESLPKLSIQSFLSQYLSGDWLDYTVAEALKVPQQHLITSWQSDYVKPLPTKIDNHMEYWVLEDNPNGDYLVHNSMIWILIHENGKHELVEMEPTSGHEYLGPSRRIVKTFDGTPKAMPSTVVKAIRINLGAYEKDERSYGARWFLYKR